MNRDKPPEPDQSLEKRVDALLCRLSAQYKAGKFQAPVIRTIPEGDPRLKLNGITLSTRTSFAVINGKTLAEGESASIPAKPRPLGIKCLKIQTNSVTVLLDGEQTPRILQFK